MNWLVTSLNTMDKMIEGTKSSEKLMVRGLHQKNTCTDASEPSEPSEPNGQPVWTAIHIRHGIICR